MKARIWGSTRWIWSRHACVAARAETSRLASFATRAEIVSWFSMTQPQPTLRPQHCGQSGQGSAKRRVGNQDHPPLLTQRRQEAKTQARHRRHGFRSAAKPQPQERGHSCPPVPRTSPGGQECPRPCTALLYSQLANRLDYCIAEGNHRFGLLWPVISSGVGGGVGSGDGGGDGSASAAY